MAVEAVAAAEHHNALTLHLMQARRTCAVHVVQSARAAPRCDRSVTARDRSRPALRAYHVVQVGMGGVKVRFENPLKPLRPLCGRKSAF